MNPSDINSFVPERRKSERIKAILPIEIPSSNTLGETIDISETGMYMRFKQRLASDPTSILLNSTTRVLLKIKVQVAKRQVLGDGVYFAAQFLDFSEKDKNQSSKLYPLTDFSPRKGVESLERGYLSGRYGALPYLKTLKKAMEC